MGRTDRCSQKYDFNSSLRHASSMARMGDSGEIVQITTLKTLGRYTKGERY